MPRRKYILDTGMSRGKLKTREIHVESEIKQRVNDRRAIRLLLVFTGRVRFDIRSSRLLLRAQSNFNGVV